MVKIEDKDYTLSLSDDGILTSVYHATDFTLEMAERSIADKLSIIDCNKLYPTIADARSLKSFKRNVRQRFLRQDSLTGIKCCAAIVKTKVQAVMGNFFIITISKQAQIPTKLFTNYEDAYKWIGKF